MTPNSPRTIWFIRHAESVANAGGRTIATAPCPLTDLGFRQAEQLAAALPEKPDFIVHSTYLRARQTAEPAVRRFASAHVEEWPVQEVQYLDPALCVNTTQAERGELAIDYWRRSEPGFAAPGAESFTAFVGRAHATLAALAARPERLIYVFTHGHFMRALAWTILQRPVAIDSAAMRLFRHFSHGLLIPNCAILPLYFQSDSNLSLGPLSIPANITREPDHPTDAAGV